MISKKSENTLSTLFYFPTSTSYQARREIEQWRIPPKQKAGNVYDMMRPKNLFHFLFYFFLTVGGHTWTPNKGFRLTL